MASESLTSRISLAVRVLFEGHDALGGSIDPDDDQFSRITGSHRDLNPIAQDRAREISFYLWRQNPMAKRLIEMIVDFVVGDGLTWSAVDQRVLDIITEWWTDPVMRFDTRHRDFVRELSLSGELALRTYTAALGGRTRMGLITPERIKDVEKDPENALVDAELVLRPKHAVLEEQRIPIVRLDDTTDPTDPQLVGEAFYYPINRPLTGHRGTPDLLALGDWLDGYDQILWNVVDRSALINAFVYDVTLTGADETAVRQWIADHGTSPKPGTVRVHNEKEAWEAVAPDIGAGQVDVASRLVKNFILGSAAIPEGWFADADASNRSALSEQADPTYRMLQSRQLLVKHMFEELGAYIVDRAVQAGRLAQAVDRTITCNIPEPSSKDMAKLTSALVAVANSLTSAIAEQLISRKSARAIFVALASQVGVELDLEDEEQLIEDEQAEADAAAVPPPDDAERAALLAMMPAREGDERAAPTAA